MELTPVKITGEVTEAINKVAESWALNLKSKLRAQSKTGNDIKVTVKKRDDLVEKISIRFDRYRVFVEKGAGRGYGGSRGSKWFSPKGAERKTNPDSLGKMGTGKRQPRPFFNPVLQEELPKLAAQVAEVTANATVKWAKNLLIK